MKKFETFYFQWVTFDTETLEAKFQYNFDNEVFFEEKIYFKYNWFNTRKDLNLKIINNILNYIHLAVWISYYKLYPTRDLVVETFKLDDFQKRFRNKFYINGLGEYLFKNNISPQDLFNFQNVEKTSEIEKVEFNLTKKAIVPIGWWKDSLVTVELLKEKWLDFDTFTFWKDYVLHSIINEIIGKNRLLITRKIDSKLFHMNKQWYYNWHVPITGIISFVLTLVSYLYDYKYIVFSNEKSANYGNINWHGYEINHQYSKSLEFEEDINNYISRFISDEIKYFSLLRWMYEIKIWKIFSQYKKYFDTFSSCNNNFKINEKTELTTEKRWCLNCPKCLFVYSILRPYLKKSEIIQIFWEDLFYDKDQENLFKQLMWIEWNKPFECVWTNEEVILSMYKMYQRYSWKWEDLPYILKIFEREILPNLDDKTIPDLETKLFMDYNDNEVPLDI